MGFAVSTSINNHNTHALVTDLSYIKEAILANPFYLGEPRHIGLHNSKGSTEHRIMRTPTPGAPTPEKWYAIACGSQVGIFLSW